MVEPRLCAQCHADDATTTRREGGSDDRLELCETCATAFDHLEPSDDDLYNRSGMCEGGIAYGNNQDYLGRRGR